MLISPAFAQAAGAGGAAGGLMSFLPFVAIIVVFYFFLIRPQQKRAKEHREMVNNVRRGDVVVTSGGIIGKITKVIDDSEAEIEITEGVRVRVLRTTLADVRSKTEPASPKASNDK
jgi:preprotein translocase subunit YajC